MTLRGHPLLIIWHGRTGTCEDLAKAAFDGSAGDGSAGSRRLLAADQVAPDDLLGAQAYLFICPENLASMSGMMKDMFDRTYYLFGPGI